MGKYDILEDSNRLLATYNEIIKPPEVIPKPRNVQIKTIPIINSTTSYTLEVTWDRPLKIDNTPETFITSYFVEFARSGDIYGNRQEILEYNSRVARYENVGTGQFKARVASLMAINNKISAWEESDIGDFSPISINLDLTNPDSFWFD